jgi:hypothetical protein
MVMQAQVQFWPIRGKIPSLNSVTFNFTETTLDFPSNIFNIFEIAPKLETILLHSPSNRHRKARLQFPWAHISTYMESGVDMGTFPVVLELAPKLEVLGYQGRNFTYQPSDLVYHTNLRSLSVNAGSLHVFREQLRKLTLPSLESFCLIVPCDHTWSMSTTTLIDFIVRSGCSLKSLALDFGPSTVQPEITNLLLLTPQLESLELGSSHLDGRTLKALVFHKERVTTLPRLRTLTLQYRMESKDEDIALLLSITSSRKNISLDDTSPGQLNAILDHVRLVSDDISMRFRTLSQLVGWEDPLENSSHLYIQVRHLLI